MILNSNFMALDVVLNTEIVIVSVLICLDVGKGLVGILAVFVGLGIHAVGLAIVVDRLAFVNCFACLSAIAFESSGDKTSHSFLVWGLGCCFALLSSSVQALTCIQRGLECPRRHSLPRNSEHVGDEIPHVLGLYSRVDVVLELTSKG